MACHAACAAGPEEIWILGFFWVAQGADPNFKMQMHVARLNGMTFGFAAMGYLDRVTIGWVKERPCHCAGSGCQNWRAESGNEVCADMIAPALAGAKLLRDGRRVWRNHDREVVRRWVVGGIARRLKPTGGQKERRAEGEKRFYRH